MPIYLKSLSTQRTLDTLKVDAPNRGWRNQATAFGTSCIERRTFKQYDDNLASIIALHYNAEVTTTPSKLFHYPVELRS